jgi:anti-sigma regulatory factor (Ser/Thr protein kinase)
MRQLSAAAALETDLAPARVLDLLTAVSEAGMNAIVHGGGTGHGAVSYDPDAGIVQVRIADSGAGISMEHLPRAAFREGYTTAGTMGFGFKLILQTIDRVWLLTGAGGTVLVIEQGRIAPGVAWA